MTTALLQGKGAGSGWDMNGEVRVAMRFIRLFWEKGSALLKVAFSGETSVPPVMPSVPADSSALMAVNAVAPNLRLSSLAGVRSLTPGPDAMVDGARSDGRAAGER
jgi:hypothetical protein